MKDFGLRLPALLDRKDAVEKLVKKKVYSIGPKRAAHIKAGWDANPRACAHPWCKAPHYLCCEKARGHWFQSNNALSGGVC